MRSVRAASELLAETRARQQRVRGEREAARDALQAADPRACWSEVGELGEQTGRFQRRRRPPCRRPSKRADSLESLAGVVQAMLDDSRAVQPAVRGTQRAPAGRQRRASELEARVRELEAELRRLSEEVSTDALTQVANRRGLMQAFEAERARCAARRPAAALAVGLIDIDNFKKLNDTLGHAAGDEALKSLAARGARAPAPGRPPGALRRRGVRRAAARHRGRPRRSRR